MVSNAWPISEHSIRSTGNIEHLLTISIRNDIMLHDRKNEN